jgi:transcription elongation factor Elf1
LAKQFKCPFCANDNVVECKMDLKVGVGKLDCRLCGASYQMPIHHLHEPIDVFSEWLDDCEAAAGGTRARGNDADQSLPQQYDDDDDDDDDIPEASGLKSKAAATKAAPAAEKSADYSALGLDDSDDNDEDDDED